MGRKLKYGELTKVLRIRIPESKYEDFRKMALKYLKKFIPKIEVIINKEPSDNNCYNCNHNNEKQGGSACDNQVYAFDVCELTGEIVDKGTSTTLEYDDGRKEIIRTADYIGNKGCNKWSPRTQLS